MKNTKFILLIILLVHLSLLFLLNTISLNFLQNKQADLNSFGKYYLKKNIKMKIPTIFLIYLNYTGSDRGFAYYSPNISRQKIRYNIIDDNKQTVNVVSNALSSKFKFDILLSNSTKIIENQKIQKQLVKSMSEYIFAKEQHIKKLIFKINIKKLKTLKEFEKTGKLYDTYDIDAYIIDRKQ